jgi:hypothetical protein
MNHDLDLLISFLQHIKELLHDDSVSEIMGDSNGQWWFERRGKLEHAEIVFDVKAQRIERQYSLRPRLAVVARYVLSGPFAGLLRDIEFGHGLGSR